MDSFWLAGTKIHWKWHTGVTFTLFYLHQVHNGFGPLDMGNRNGTRREVSDTSQHYLFEFTCDITNFYIPTNNKRLMTLLVDADEQVCAKHFGKVTRAIVLNDRTVNYVVCLWISCCKKKCPCLLYYLNPLA